MELGITRKRIAQLMCGSRVPKKQFMGQMRACGERTEKGKE